MSNIAIRSTKFVVKAVAGAVIGLSVVVGGVAFIIAGPSIKQDYEDAAARAQLSKNPEEFQFAAKDLAEASTAQGRMKMITEASIQWGFNNGVPTDTNVDRINILASQVETMSPKQAILLALQLRDPKTKEVPMSLPVVPEVKVASAAVDATANSMDKAAVVMDDGKSFQATPASTRSTDIAMVGGTSIDLKGKLTRPADADLLRVLSDVHPSKLNCVLDFYNKGEVASEAYSYCHE